MAAVNESLNQLLQMGMSKWKIAKRVGVSWHTVHMWQKGVFQPMPIREKHLSELVKEMRKGNQ